MQFILGALDPEMHTIEQLLTQHKRHFTHAKLGGRRVISGNAYVADALSGEIDWTQPVVWVECSVPALRCAQHLVADHHKPGDPGYSLPAERYWQGSSIGQVCAFLGVAQSKALSIIAASDHCLNHAYQGHCPGVEPHEVRQSRINSRAKFQGISPAQMLSKINAAVAVINGLPSIEIAGHPFKDAMDRFVPELPEASAMLNMPIIYTRREARLGLTKVGVLNGTAPALTAWMQWAAEQSYLMQLYGDPDRGYAGAYVRPTS
ncbi:MAG: hypothetical protein K2Y25_07510 [Pseudomonadaceae bacterium]|jgi:hypothetical protein|nr:hypothetical protein [Pseudomonadaceae bacterium]